jgi:hypothetical protein
MGRNASTSFSAETRSPLTTTASTFAPRPSLGAIIFSGTWSAGQKQQTKSKEKGNEQVRIKAKRDGATVQVVAPSYKTPIAVSCSCLVIGLPSWSTYVGLPCLACGCYRLVNWFCKGFPPSNGWIFLLQNLVISMRG